MNKFKNFISNRIPICVLLFLFLFFFIWRFFGLEQLLILNIKYFRFDFEIQIKWAFYILKFGLFLIVPLVLLSLIKFAKINKIINYVSIAILFVMLIPTIVIVGGVTREIRFYELNDYHIIYDNVDNLNHLSSHHYDTLLYWGEYGYCSYFALFPDKQPSTLQEFYMTFSPVMDFDCYEIYFTYSLESEEYEIAKNRLAIFNIKYNDQVKMPIYDEINFSYPTYVFTWMKSIDNKTADLCEYVMLDDENNTLINVYSFGFTNTFGGRAKYDYLPKTYTFQNELEKYDANNIYFGSDYYIRFSGFSIYSFIDNDGVNFIPEKDELIYDTYFKNIN